ncbi:MAG TPA: hypothetical protein ENK66_02195 [Arcobacter sp.]|nr:hypothetical protein [Arcobacter sp.]
MYKKFIIKLGISLIVLISIYSVFVLNFKMYYMNAEYPMWQEVKDRSSNKTNIIEDIVILGDSRAKAGFKPSILKKTSSINLSMGGATPLEGYYTIKKYLNHNPNPKNLIISYTPVHLSISYGCFFSRTVPFDFLENNEYSQVEKLALQFSEFALLEKNAEFDTGENATYIKYKFPMIYGKSFINGILHREWLKNYNFYKYLKKERGYHYFGTKDISHGLNEETEEKQFVVSRLYDYYFKKILILMNKKHIKVYSYVMPFNETSFKAVKKQYDDQYEKYLLSLSKKYNMKICNKVFYMPDSAFGDSSHLFHGVKKSTIDIVKCVEK